MNRKKIILFLSSASVSLATCSLLKTAIGQSIETANVQEYLQQKKPKLYQNLLYILDAANKDAQVATQDEVVKNLWKLSPDNPKISMRENNSQREYLMVSWININPKNQDKWKPGTNTLDRRTWLTAASQVKFFCRNCKGTGLDIPGNIMLSLRLQQYLGLRLESSKTHFVEMWVKEKDLKRPCINEEVNNNSCKLLPKNISTSHPDLMQIKAENIKYAYPWTGLGYTYDWGNPQKPRVGASEFIVNGTKEKPVEVEILTVTETKGYCNNKFLTP